MTLFETAVAYVYVNEGGFVNDPADTPTKYGITLATLQAWRTAKGLKAPVTVQDVQQLTVAEAQSIYKTWYWTRMGGDALTSQPVATVLLDMCVLNGSKVAPLLVQAAVNTVANTTLVLDGIIGSKSVAAINACDSTTLVQNLVAVLHTRYLAIAKQQPAKRKFHKNWQKRSAYYLDLLLPA